MAHCVSQFLSRITYYVPRSTNPFRLLSPRRVLVIRLQSISHTVCMWVHAGVCTRACETGYVSRAVVFVYTGEIHAGVEPCECAREGEGMDVY